MAETSLDATEITELFTLKDGSYRFARWNRPIAPVVFGVDDDTLIHLKSAIATTVGITGHSLAETDPELGSNFMWFFCKSWDEIAEIPNLDNLIPNIQEVVEKLKETNSTSYRWFTLDEEGGIKLSVLMIRMSDEMADTSVQVLGTSETFQSLLSFAPSAFKKESPIAVIEANNLCIAKPKYAALVRAAYDPVLPAGANDPAHGLRLFARAQKLLADVEE